MRKLQIAFSKKEKAEQLLANLEELKEQGDLEETQYEAMKAEYESLLTEGETEIEAIKEELAKASEPYRKDIEIYSQELKNLEMRLKVGDLSEDKYKQEKQRVRSRLERIEQRVAQSESLLQATSSAEVGGFIDVRMKKASAPPKEKARARGAGEVAKKLQVAFSKKEKAKKVLSNLEHLKDKGTVDEAQYIAMKSEYSEVLKQANAQIKSIKEELEEALEKLATEQETHEQELKNLEARFKVGQIQADPYRRTEQKSRTKIERIEQRVAEFEKSLSSKSSSDVGGYVDIPLAEKAAAKKEKALRSMPSIPSFREVSTAIRRESGASFTGFIGSIEEIAIPRAKLIGLISGVLVFISVFLKWEAISSMGITIAFPGTSISGGIEAIAIIAGIFCVLATFLENPKASGFVHVSAGVLALLVMLPTWFSRPTISAEGIPPEYWGGEDFWGEIENMMRVTTTIREGFYLFIIASLGAIGSGLRQLLAK